MASLLAKVAWVGAILFQAAYVAAQNQVKPDDGTGIHVYYQTSWPQVNIHYSADSGSWTNVPGVLMTASTGEDSLFPAGEGWFRYDLPTASSVEFVTNNNQGTWDNNANANFKIAAPGTYSIVSAVAPPVATTGIRVYYQTSWTEVNIHYSANGGGWTNVPGLPMTPATGDDPSYPTGKGWFVYELPTATSLEFVTNNNQGSWDNNKDANFKIAKAGTYAYVSTIAPPSSTPPEACTNFNGWDTCNSTDLDSPLANDARKWQTPARNATAWKPSYQDYRSLTGYAHVTYDRSRASATVAVRTNLRVPAAEASCVYLFNGVTSPRAEFKATARLTQALAITVRCTHRPSQQQWTLELDPVNFVWQNQRVPHLAPGHECGQRGAIVDMFGWPYKDIEEECKDFLGKAGYLGVKINPPQEALMSDDQLQDGQRNPWYYVYQPISYRLYSRLGSRGELRSMIQTCRANGVRVYADAVVNHMTGGSDIEPTHRLAGAGGQCLKWGGKSSTKGSPYFSHQYHFENNNATGLRPAMEFPAVPYAPSDFHCERLTGSDNTDPVWLNGQWLVGLADLNTGKQSVRERIAQYYVDLLGIGFSGFRIDAYKHIHPRDHAAIFGLLNKYLGGSLPDDFLMWGEITLDPGQAPIVACDENSGYNFYKGLDKLLLASGIAARDIAKLKIWSADYPRNHPVCGKWVLPPSRFVVQNDDHDQQAADSTTRPMGDKGSVLVLDKDVAKHRSFEVLLFNRTDADWKIKVVLSSYTHFADGTAGFPDGFSDCAGFDASGSGQKCARSVPYEKAFRKGSCGYTVEGFKGGKYTRVHRDLAIVSAMRKWVGLKRVTAKQLGITEDCSSTA